MAKERIVSDNPFARFLFDDTKMAWLWLLVRLYVGYKWVTAGWSKLHSSSWVGSQAGSALSGFIQGAFSQSVGAHADVTNWYVDFCKMLYYRMQVRGLTSLPMANSLLELR